MKGSAIAVVSPIEKITTPQVLDGSVARSFPLSTQDFIFTNIQWATQELTLRIQSESSRPICGSMAAVDVTTVRMQMGLTSMCSSSALALVEQ